MQIILKTWVILLNQSELLDLINKTPLIELYQMRATIDRALNDPNRLNKIKRNLKVGQAVRFFSGKENRFIQATVSEINNTRVRVVNDMDGQRWAVPLFMIDIDNAEGSVTSASTTVDRMTLKVGEKVGFMSKQGNDLYGIVTKLNPKTAEVKLESGERWRVQYDLLFYVLEGQYHSRELRALIEGELAP